MPIVLNLAVACFFIKGNSQQLHNDFLVGALLLWSFFMAAGFGKKENWKHPLISETGFFVIVFLLSPFAFMLGTNNMFYYSTSHLLCLSLAGAILWWAANATINPRLLSLLCGFVFLFVGYATYQGGVKTPYRQEDLTEKRIPLMFHPALNGILESEARYKDYCVLNAVLNQSKTKTGKTAVFFNHFGVYYIANQQLYNQSPLSDSESYIVANQYILSRQAQPLSACEQILVPESIVSNKQFNTFFSENGVSLGVNYKSIFSYTFASSGENVYLYKKQK